VEDAVYCIALRPDVLLLDLRMPQLIQPLELDFERRTLCWTDRGNPPHGNTAHCAPMDLAAKDRVMAAQGNLAGITYAEVFLVSR